MGPASRGKAIVNLLQLGKNETIADHAPRPASSADEPVHRSWRPRSGVDEQDRALSAFSRPRRDGIIAINIDQGDRLLDVRTTPSETTILLATAHGYAIRFRESDARRWDAPPAACAA